ncbi:MAG TPA: hypothetical protein QF804_07150 [Rhodospirillales bacterium]|nr:hypothetical protein [Rhodospirillales bacterium]
MMIALVRPGSGARGWHLFAAALAAMILVGPQVSEAAERCRSTHGALEVTLTSIRGELGYDGSHSEADLSRLYLKSGGSARWHGWNPAGLTLADLELGLRIQVRARPLSGERFCTELAQVEVTLGYRTIDVYVARRYRRGACEYEQILDHENRHVAIFRDVLAEYGPRVRHALERESGAQAPLIATSPGTGAERFKDRLRNEMAPLFREITQALDRGHATLDTAENYRAEQRLCTNW